MTDGRTEQSIEDWIGTSEISQIALNSERNLGIKIGTEEWERDEDEGGLCAFRRERRRRIKNDRKAGSGQGKLRKRGP